MPGCYVVTYSEFVNRIKELGYEISVDNYYELFAYSDVDEENTGKFSITCNFNNSKINKKVLEK